MKTYLAIISLILAMLLLAGCASTAASPANIDAAEISSVPAAPATLDKSAAVIAALDDAGLTEAEVSDLRMEYDVDDGVPQYEVDFRCGDTEYDYTIHAETGAVLEKDQDYEPVRQPAAAAPTEAPATEPPATEPPATEAPAEKLTADEAKAIALADAGLKESDVTGLKAEFDADDNEYDIDFRSGGYDYDYSVNAKTGVIREKDKEKEAVQTASTGTTKTSSNTKSTSSTKTSSSSSKITVAKAKSIALADAGLKESAVTGLRAVYDADDSEYDVDFRSGDYEYDYSINAKTGKIKSRDKEYDPEKKPVQETKPAATEPPATEPPATEAPKASEPAEEKISASKAKSIALKHAGLSESKVTGLRAEYDVDDGVKEYDVEFRSGDYEYDYTIHAVTGEIRSWDKEYDPVKKPVQETKPAATEPPATEPPATEPPATEAPKATEPAEEKISASKAKSIALKHAGVSSGDVKGMECEYDVDDGRKVYEISFRAGKYEYDYDINAITGKILSWDKEIDD